MPLTDALPFSINRHIQGPKVVLSRSTVAKTLKKDLAGVEKRLARFRMDAELPGGCGQWMIMRCDG